MTAISEFADGNANAVEDSGEPSAQAAAAWRRAGGNLAVTQLQAPRTIALTARRPSVEAIVKVVIQNRGSAAVSAAVNRVALDGQVDADRADDQCPRAPAIPRRPSTRAVASGVWTGAWTRPWSTWSCGDAARAQRTVTGDLRLPLSVIWARPFGRTPRRRARIPSKVRAPPREVLNF
jgi:hypothetical protein